MVLPKDQGWACSLTPARVDLFPFFSLSQSWKGRWVGEKEATLELKEGLLQMRGIDNPGMANPYCSLVRDRIN